jgi:hypothetical protein
MIDIHKFVEEIKNPEKLLKGCERFHKAEPRDIIYVVSGKIISENTNNLDHILAGIKTLLSVWNTQYLRMKKKEIRERLEDDILEAYRESTPYFDKLHGEKLEDVDLNNSEIVGAVKTIFRNFSNRESIGITGASKAIHLIKPQLFMIWDSSIKRAYYRIRPYYRKKAEGDSVCYVEFMKKSQEIAKSIFTKISASELWEKHLLLLKEEKRQFLKTFAHIETLPKMLDECNYVRITQKTIF